MTYTEHIKAGIAIANRNWQLIIIQIGAILLNLVGMFAFIVVPVIVLGVALGIEAERAGDISRWLDGFSPAAELGQYLGAILVILLCLFVFITFALIVWLFVAGGTVGTLAGQARDKVARFSMEGFWQEGKRLFFPLAWFYTIVSVFLIAIIIVLGGAFVLGALGYNAAGLDGSRLGVFFSVMGSLLLGACGLFFSFCLYAVTIQGLAPLSLEGQKAMDSIKAGWNFLEEDTSNLHLLLVLVGAYIVVQIVLAVTGGIIQLIPFVGLFIYMPYSIAANIFSIYLNLVLVSAVLSHYAQKKGLVKKNLSEPESSPLIDTSPSEGGWQVPPHFYPGKNDPDQH